MNMPKWTIFFLLLPCISTLQGRRKKIVSRDNLAIPHNITKQPVLLHTQNDLPPEDLLPQAEEKIPLEEEIETNLTLTAPNQEDFIQEEPAIQDEFNSTLPEDSYEQEEITNNYEEPPEEEEERNIYLNFENADLKTFVNYISELKNINLIPDPKIAGNKISLTIREPLTLEGAWNIFLTILEMSGFSIVKVGEIHKIVPKNQKLKEPLPTYINVASDDLPDSDLTIRFVTFLTNIPIEQIKPLLQSMLSQPNQIIDHPNANGFVITDKSHNIKAAMKVIQELDRADIKQSVTVMRLKQANADDVKKLFESLMKKPEGNPIAKLLGRSPENSVEYFPPTTKIISEPRTNSLILLGDQKSINRIEEFIINHVDKELKGVKSPLHIYELKHTDVDQIKEILEAINESSSDSPAAKYGGIRGGLKYFKKMKFSMDKANNRLLVSSTDNHDWKLLKKTIKDLDKPQPQVAIETLIVSVDFNDSKELGSQIHSKKPNTLGHNVAGQAANLTSVIKSEDGTSVLGNLLRQMTFGLGSTVLTFGSTQNVWAMIKMLKTQVNTSVLSQPFIVTTNMRESTISVGEIRRVQTQQAISELNGSGGDAYGYEDATANLTIKVKPQINLEGIINLGIDVDIKEFEAGDSPTPDSTTRKLNTKVSVANGQVLVLGGFVKTKVTESTYRTPFLGRIPVLGWLFKNKKREIEKEYIFIFMSPTIIKPRSLPGVNLYTKMKLNQAKTDIDDAIEVRKVVDPIHNWFFNPDGETYSHKIVDFANARYQPTSVDIKNDPYYRALTLKEEKENQERQPSLEQERSEVETLSTEQEPQLEIPSPVIENYDSQENQEEEIEPSQEESISTPLEEPEEEFEAEDIPMIEQEYEEPDTKDEELLNDIQSLINQTEEKPEIEQSPKIEETREQQRQRLKNLLSAQIPTQNKKTKRLQTFLKTPAPKNKKQNLKQFLSHKQPNTTQMQTSPGNKRSSLKQMLSTSRPIALHNSKRRGE